MSQTSYTIFYRTEALPDPVQSITDIIQVMQPTGSVNVRTSSLPDHSWEMFQVELRGEDADELFPEEDEQSISGVNPSWVHTFYKPGGLLSMDFISKVDHLKDAVVSGVPESIRGNYGPINLAVRVGFHDLWECLEHDDVGFYFDRAFLSFNFWGYSTPRDGQRFRDVVFQLPEVLAMQHLLETTVGPLRHCFFSV